MNVRRYDLVEPLNEGGPGSASTLYTKPRSSPCPMSSSLGTWGTLVAPVGVAAGAGESNGAVTGVSVGAVNGWLDGARVGRVRFLGSGIAPCHEGKKRKASVFAEDVDDSVEETESPAPQVEVVDLTAELDDDDGVAPTEDAVDWEAKGGVKHDRLGQLEQQAAADLVKSAMHTVGAEGVLKLLEQHLAREEAAKKARAPEEAKAKAKRAEEAKAIAAAAATKAGVGRKEGNASVKGTVVKTEAKVKGEAGGPASLETKCLSESWGSPAGWGGVDFGYVRDITRRLTVVGEFDETRDD
ncbi:hypothetical protein DYB28_000084 [Aphanomyces astaci]|uniref:Uncharacterized protein n=2 Tax=Aphanomyces astaci TaxID=112090 RepID=A0A9X8E7B8_APHAT|nr:hypothetical protein DYB28_000084 [Aphanomyces astaci]